MNDNKRELSAKSAKLEVEGLMKNFDVGTTYPLSSYNKTKKHIYELLDLLSQCVDSEFKKIIASTAVDFIPRGMFETKRCKTSKKISFILLDIGVLDFFGNLNCLYTQLLFNEHPYHKIRITEEQIIEFIWSSALIYCDRNITDCKRYSIFTPKYMTSALNDNLKPYSYLFLIGQLLFIILHELAHISIDSDKKQLEKDSKQITSTADDILFELFYEEDKLRNRNLSDDLVSILQNLKRNYSYEKIRNNESVKRTFENMFRWNIECKADELAFDSIVLLLENMFQDAKSISKSKEEYSSYTLSTIIIASGMDIGFSCMNLIHECFKHKPEFLVTLQMDIERHPAPYSRRKTLRNNLEEYVNEEINKFGYKFDEIFEPCVKRIKSGVTPSKQYFDNIQEVIHRFTA